MADKILRTIKAISVKNLHEGSIGFLTNEESTHWYNVSADKDALEMLLKEVIGKGNLIEFEMINGFPGNFKLLDKAAEQPKESDDLTNFETLLNDAHEKGLYKIETDMVQVDMEKKYAIFRAIVTLRVDEKIDGVKTGSTLYKTFSAYGDATQDNCGNMVQKHFIRMAETRAIARALRWATNNAKASSEETEKGDLPGEEKPEEHYEENPDELPDY